MPQLQDPKTLRGCTLRDSAGEKIGKVDEIYLDTESGRPEWALVNTGLFGTKSTFVPIRDVTGSGDELTVPLKKSMVKDAPRIDADGQLSHDEERELYRHYSMDWGPERSTEGRFGGTSGTTRETTGRTSDDAMTRSEEEMRVGKMSEPTGRARLRKYVVTEEVNQTIPVQREEVRVEREPITDSNRDRALSGPEITESEHEVTLHEERPVVEKQTVPKERVRLSKDTSTEQADVSGEVRKERIEVDDDTGRRRS